LPYKIRRATLKGVEMKIWFAALLVASPAFAGESGSANQIDGAVKFVHPTGDPCHFNYGCSLVEPQAEGRVTTEQRESEQDLQHCARQQDRSWLCHGALPRHDLQDAVPPKGFYDLDKVLAEEEQKCALQPDKTTWRCSGVSPMGEVLVTAPPQPKR
jgi:hypothetical protein